MCVISGEMTEDEQEFIIENVDKTDWIKVHVDSSDSSFPVHYSAELLNNWFPKDKYTSKIERIEHINRALGIEISIIKIDMLIDSIQKI
uniref:Uncharacterized protein n=1 Tax=Panagrolaimus sp. JU765 TaxID=591449 RepID=A0AC34Q3J3_9BILA